MAGLHIWGEPMDPTRGEAVKLAERAVALDPNYAGNRWVLGFVRAHDHRWSKSEAEFSAALELDPNHADAWAILSDISVMRNLPADALEHSHGAFTKPDFAPARIGDGLQAIGVSLGSHFRNDGIARSSHASGTKNTRYSISY